MLRSPTLLRLSDQSPLLPFSQRHVYFGVEEDEQRERDDAEADKTEPVEVDRVINVPPQFRRKQNRITFFICNIMYICIENK